MKPIKSIELLYLIFFSFVIFQYVFFYFFRLSPGGRAKSHVPEQNMMSLRIRPVSNLI